MSDHVGRVVQWTLWSDPNPDSTHPATEMVIHGSGGAAGDAGGGEPTREIQCTAGRRDPFRWSLRGRVEDAGPAELAPVVELVRSPDRAQEVWEHACRGVELADTIEMSSRRGKTIQLFHEEHSEASTFKSVMAAGGCLSILAILALIPFIAVADRVFVGLGTRLGMRNLPWIAVAAVLLLFLLAQALLLVARRRRDL